MNRSDLVQISLPLYCLCRLFYTKYNPLNQLAVTQTREFRVESLQSKIYNLAYENSTKDEYSRYDIWLEMI